jgi:hypothetical protein
MAKRSNMAMKAGAGILTAAALGAAAAYLLSSKKQKASAKAWAVKARKEVAKHIETARRMGEKQYHQAVAQATKHYASLHDVSAPEVAKVARDMKGEWKQLQANAMKLAKMTGVRKAAKPVRRAARKASRAKRK